MQITVNGKSVKAAAGLTVAQLLVQEGFPLQRIAVERNNEILPGRLYESTAIMNGDVYEIVRFVGGG